MEQSPEKLMTNQFITNQKINDLLDLASEYIECGPECQENKKSQELYDKYIKSQTSLKMAPNRLEKNKKNYYVYTYGPAYYEDIKKEEMTENSAEIVDKILNEFNSQIENALMMNKLLETTDPESNCSDQYPIIQKKLNYELHKKTNDTLLNNRETYYSNETIERLEYWNKFWLFVYYFIIFIFLILCFPKTKYEFIKYGIVIGLAFLYIFTINHSFLYFQTNKFKIIISIIYFIILLIIILFILYKIATTFKYVLINLTDTITKIYNFSEK
jgi:hypothetical protein